MKRIILFSFFLILLIVQVKTKFHLTSVNTFLISMKVKVYLVLQLAL